MNALRIVLTLAATALLLGACTTTPRVYSNADPQADFAGYSSFGFVERPGTDRGEYTSLLTGRLQHTTRQAMEARGYRYSDTAPDLLVNFNVSTTTRVESNPTMLGWGGYYPYRWGHYGPWSGWHHDTVREYHEGTLNIDLVDAAQRRLVWEGMAVTRLGRDPHVQRNDTIDAAVAGIFERFPYRAGR